MMGWMAPERHLSAKMVIDENAPSEGAIQEQLVGPDHPIRAQ